ncbi:hypothetical protein OJAV_G00107300 [Oryzias javanicus]|uniref:Uncharacterized protein n=1 Tax=Oryzias javanicus TaxID=123683 RepID=A0A3S2PPI8_ORYJA|nr:hypothetical protein OJAV_G00107300 [Oryzias javanicus]
MDFGVGLRILLIFLQAERLYSWAPAEQAPISGGRQVRFYQKEGRLRSLEGPPSQKQVFSPRSAQSSSFNSQTQHGPGRTLHSGSSRLPAAPTSSHTGGGTSVKKEQKGVKGAGPAQTGARSFSFSAAARSGPQKIPGSYKDPIASSASLFSPVGPAPRGSQVRMQTYARAPAKKVSLSNEPKASRLPFGSKHVSQKFPAGGYKPKFSPAQQTAPGFAPAKVVEIPESLGGWAIRRLGDSTNQNQNQVEVQKPQLKPAPPPPPKEQMEAYKLKSSSLHPASKWSRVKIRSRL